MQHHRIAADGSKVGSNNREVKSTSTNSQDSHVTRRYDEDIDGLTSDSDEGHDKQTLAPPSER